MGIRHFLLRKMIFLDVCWCKQLLLYVNFTIERIEFKFTSLFNICLGDTIVFFAPTLLCMPIFSRSTFIVEKSTNMRRFPRNRSWFEALKFENAYGSWEFFNTMDGKYFSSRAHCQWKPKAVWVHSWRKRVNTNYFYNIY